MRSIYPRRFWFGNDRWVPRSGPKQRNNKAKERMKREKETLTYMRLRNVNIDIVVIDSDERRTENAPIPPTTTKLCLFLLPVLFHTLRCVLLVFVLFMKFGRWRLSSALNSLHSGMTLAYKMHTPTHPYAHTNTRNEMSRKISLCPHLCVFVSARAVCSCAQCTHKSKQIHSSQWSTDRNRLLSLA